MMNDIDDPPPPRPHLILIDPEQAKVTQDNLAFVDIETYDTEGNENGVISVYHPMLLDLAARMLRAHAELLRDRTP